MTSSTAGDTQTTDVDSRFAVLPKVELHVHLDCCISFDAAGRLKPGLSEQDYRRQFIAPAKCLDLADLLSTITNALAIMQTQEQLHVVIEDLFQQFEADQIVYAEIRFGPFLHTQNGLNARRVVEIVERKVSDMCDATGIEARIILCTLRHYTQSQSRATVNLVRDFSGSRVVALDLSADEAGFPIDAHISAFRRARDLGIYRTAHAGEARGPASVWETLEHLKPARIGHGVRSLEDPNLVTFLAENAIHLEVCPSCNVQIDIFPTLDKHSIHALSEAGVSVGVNTDGRALSGVTLTQEYQRLHDAFGYDESDFRSFNQNALNAAFLDEATRQTLMAKIA